MYTFSMPENSCHGRLIAIVVEKAWSKVKPSPTNESAKLGYVLLLTPIFAAKTIWNYSLT